MKKLMVMAVTTTILGLSANAQAGTKLDTHLEKQLVEVCEALKSDSRLQLNRVMKNNGFTYRSIANGLRCNGTDAVSFALENGAKSTATIVARRGNIATGAMLAKL